MYKKSLLVTLVGAALPALALASQPLWVRFGGQSVPVRENVQVTRTASGPVRVRTWSWRGPNGVTTVQVSQSRSAHAALPPWAVAQMRALQDQMRQMRLIQAALERSMAMPSPAVPVIFGGPLLPMLAPSMGLPLEVRVVQPLIPVEPVLVPAHVIAIVPVRPAPVQRTPARHHGHLI